MVISKRAIRQTLVVVCTIVFLQPASAEDWLQFRGPDGCGISTAKGLPIQWDDTKNLQWKVELPGPGSSSPIVIGDKICLTCYSGYGTENGSQEISDLKRHVLCYDRKSGKRLWEKIIDARMPEDRWKGFIQEHGYASNTPVSDGKRLYVFLGKTGVFAFDLNGKQLWQKDAGQKSSNRRWGSAASLILHENILIVNASEESQSLLGLNKLTGKELWKSEADLLELSFGTPALVRKKNQPSELVLAVPGEVWGLNAKNGKLRWYVETNLTGNISPSVIAKDGVVYAYGGYRGSGSLAIRTGGTDDVSKSHVLWRSRESSYVATPLLYEGKLYWVNDRGIAHCVDAESGKLMKQKRLSSTKGSLGSRPFYASLVLADGHLYAVSRRAGTFVFQATPEFEVVSENHFQNDNTDFNATPAISNGQIFLRSNRFLYCLSKQK